MNIEKLRIKNGVSVYASSAIEELFLDYQTDSSTLVFEVCNENDLYFVCEKLTKLGDTQDTLIWLIYVKGQKTLNRNNVIKHCEDKNYRPVSQVSLSSTYSALRIRFRKFVK